MRQSRIELSSINGMATGVPIAGADPYRLLWSDASSLLSDALPEHRVAATETASLHLEGDTNPYTGTEINPVGIQLTRTIGNISEATQEGFYYAGINNVINDLNPLTGTVADATYNVTNFYANLVALHTDTVNWGDGSISYTLYYGSATPNITATGTGHPLILFGQDISISPTITYNNAGGTYTLSTTGQRINISNTITLTAGAFTLADYGQQIYLLGTGSGTSTGYGIFLSVQSYDTNWLVYGTTDTTSYFRGNVWINELTGTAMLEAEADVATAPILILRQAAAQSVIGFTYEDSSGNDLFTIGPPAAGTPTAVIWNTTDGTSNKVMQFQGNKRATSLDNDEAYLSFTLENSNSDQKEVARITWVIQDETLGTEDGQVKFYAVNNSSLLEIMNFDNNNVIFNDASADVNFRVETNNQANALFIDGGTDLIGMFQGTPAAFLDLLGVTPASIGTTPGTTATQTLKVVGGVGGATTATATPVGGVGSLWSIAGGAGGAANSGTSGTATGGVGGAGTTNTGAGGGISHSQAGVLARGGAGGIMTASTGAGGSGSNSSTGGATGGAGGAHNITAGNGGSATGTGASTATGGAGGAITITAGTPGTPIGSTTLAVGAAGITTINGGTGGSISSTSVAAGTGGALNLNGGSGGTQSSSAAGGAGGAVTAAGGAGSGSSSATAGAGGAFTARGGTGGSGSMTTAGAGGSATYTGGTGGTASSTNGAAGTTTVSGGTGGGQASSLNGQNGGTLTLQGGTGGSTTTGTSGNGGATTLAGGVAGTNSGGVSGVGGIILFRTAATTSLTTNGNISVDGRWFIGGATTATAILHLVAGTTAASTAPLKFTTGTSMTAAEAGAVEFTTDDLFFTITTGTARKRLLMADPVGGLTSTRVPFATTNGRLTDDADFTFATDTLTITKIAATQHTGNVTMADGINFVLNTTTGTKIGTGTTQKLGFYDAAPVVQGASIADATGGVVIDAECRTATNALISRLEATGLIATV